MVQETRQDILDRVLRNLHVSVPGMNSAVIVNIDGLLVATYPSDANEENAHLNPTSSPQVAAMAATLFGLAERTLERLAQGDLERILMEAELGVMVAYPAGRAVLAVLVGKDTKLGMVLYASARAAKEITDVLEN